MTNVSVTIDTKKATDVINKFLKDIKKNRDEILRKAVSSFARKVFDDTPVLTSLLKSSWRGGVNQKNSSSSLSASPGAGFDNSLLFTGAKFGDTFFLFNSQPYAVRIEFGFVNQTDSLGRTFSGPPAANMVRQNLPFFDTFLEEAARKVNV